MRLRGVERRKADDGKRGKVGVGKARGADGRRLGIIDVRCMSISSMGYLERETWGGDN